MEQVSNIVTVKDLTVAYNSKPVLVDVNLSIPSGKLVAIVGPNGAGKTTLLKCLLGLIRPLAGEIHFHDDNSMHVAKRIAYVPQSGSVDWDFPATALDVVLMGRYGHIGLFKRPGKAEKTLAYEMLEKVGMKEFAKRQIGNLSGGQQQRVFLARALIQEANIYFMDEPFKGVDAQTEASIVKILSSLKDEGKTIVVVHHALDTVAAYFDCVILINSKVVASGRVCDVFNEENITRTYSIAYESAEDNSWLRL